MNIHRNACPVCSCNKVTLQFIVNDFSVTKQPFELMCCNECTLIFTQSVPDESSIGAYYHFEDYISHTDTSKSFFHKIYHRVRNFTLSQKLGWIKKYTGKTAGRLLDIGCGTGAFLSYAKNKKWQIDGIEADAEARKNALQINQINALPNEHLFALQGQYDAITMWHVLEHVHSLHEYLQQIQRLLTTNGRLFIAVPNHTSYDAQHYKQYWAAYDVPRHLYHFNPVAMQTLAKQYNFTIEAYKPMLFDSVYVSLLSEKYKKGSAIKGIAIGLFSNINALFNKKKCSSITYVLRKN